MKQSLAQFFSHIHRIGFSEKLLYILSFMLFFFTVFDGVLGYLVPIVVTQSGMTKTEMGFIFGSSSLFGGIFDFLLSKYLGNTHFRRIYLFMFGLCFVYPLILWNAKGVWLFLIAMAVWGLYFDLENFGNFDFVGRGTNEDGHASHFGIITVFKSLGYLVAPLIAGLLIGEVTVGWKPYVFSLVMIGIAFLFFIMLLTIGKRRVSRDEREIIKRKINVIRELTIWKGIGKILLPVLALTVSLNILDAFFWTIGPLLAESYGNLHPFNGLFMTVYELPPLLIGWFVGGITGRFGKKRTAFFSFLLGSLILLMIPYVSNAIGILIVVFAASSFYGFSLPSINGAYGDYIGESTTFEKEIEGLEDFATNVGYVIGPIMAGFFADRFGNIPAFAVLGVVGIIISGILLKITPRSIRVSI